MLRRPLGNGLPIPLTGLSTADVIYDLTSATEDTQQRVHLVTLYAIALSGDRSGTLSIQTIADGSNYQLVRRGMDQLRDAQINGFEMVKVLDRYPLRGDASIQASLSADPGDQGCVIVGYVELEGVANPAQAVRPLQPSNTLVSPYTTTPTVRAGIAAATQVHLLEQGRTDEITLYGWIGTAGLSPHLVFSDGVTTVDINVGDLFATAGSGVTRSGKILDGIPMLGAGAGGGIQAYTDGATDQMVLYGSFIRR